jgi:YggT family protein
MEYISRALIFLSNTIFDLYILIVMMRLLMFRFAAYYTHPACQFVYRTTEWPLKPLNKIMPLFFGFETGAALFIFLLIMLKLFITAVLSGYLPNVMGLMVLSLAFFISKFLNFYFFLVIAFVFLSWIMPFIDSTIMQIIGRMAMPLMSPFQRMIPPVGGIDLSPVMVILLLQVLKILVAYPLIAFGARLAGG